MQQAMGLGRGWEVAAPSDLLHSSPSSILANLSKAGLLNLSPQFFSSCGNFSFPEHVPHLAQVKVALGLWD